MPVFFNEAPLPTVDAHVHVGRRAVPLSHGVPEFLADQLIENMDKAGVDRAVMFPLGAPYTDYSAANQLLADQVAKCPERLIGFCRINPNFGPAATAATLEHCLGTLKLRGVKLHPGIEFFQPNDQYLMEPIYEAARKYHVPLIFHTGMFCEGTPATIGELAGRYPDVPVILGHMGIVDFCKDAVVVARQYENVYLETSAVSWITDITNALRQVGSSKVIYGSDHPYNPLSMEIEKLTRHAAEAAKLGEDNLRKMMAGNLLSILNY